MVNEKEKELIRQAWDTSYTRWSEIERFYRGGRSSVRIGSSYFLAVLFEVEKADRGKDRAIEPIQGSSPTLLPGG